LLVSEGRASVVVNLAATIRLWRTDRRRCRQRVPDATWPV
jgi:hypothetical protein